MFLEKVHKNDRAFLINPLENLKILREFREDRIFTNVYADEDVYIEGALKRGGTNFFCENLMMRSKSMTAPGTSAKIGRNFLPSTKTKPCHSSVSSCYRLGHFDGILYFRLCVLNRGLHP